MRTRLTLLLVGILLASACASQAPARRAPPRPPPPFRPAKVAWQLVVQANPELAPPRDGTKGPLPQGLAAFYAVVSKDSARKAPRERHRACLEGWQGLARAQKAAPEHAGQLAVAQAYLGTRCGFSQKALPVLRKLVKQHRQPDLLLYSAHFFWAEALLEMERPADAAERYRYVLGELESPLYPLALYRTAQCHWDAGDVDRAREYLQHAIDWTGERREPSWVVALRRRARMELGDFEE